MRKLRRRWGARLAPCARASTGPECSSARSSPGKNFKTVMRRRAARGVAHDLRRMSGRAARCDERGAAAACPRDGDGTRGRMPGLHAGGGRTAVADGEPPCIGSGRRGPGSRGARGGSTPRGVRGQNGDPCRPSSTRRGLAPCRRRAGCVRRSRMGDSEPVAAPGCLATNRGGGAPRADAASRVGTSGRVHTGNACRTGSRAVRAAGRARTTARIHGRGAEPSP